MSKDNLERVCYLFKHGFTEKIHIKAFLKFRRHNAERHYFKPRQNKLKEKILNKELKTQLHESNND